MSELRWQAYRATVRQDDYDVQMTKWRSRDRRDPQAPSRFTISRVGAWAWVREHGFYGPEVKRWRWLGYELRDHDRAHVLPRGGTTCTFRVGTVRGAKWLAQRLSDV